MRTTRSRKRVDVGGHPCLALLMRLGAQTPSRVRIPEPPPGRMTCASPLSIVHNESHVDSRRVTIATTVAVAVGLWPAGNLVTSERLV